MRSSRAIPIRALSVLGVALLAVVLVAGISPGATKFLTKKKALKLFPRKADVHTKTEADAAFLNVNEKATSAGTADTANNADLLDGQNSTAFMAGPGKVVDGAVNINNGESANILTEPGFFEVNYFCPAVVSNNGTVEFINLAPDLVDVFMDDGSDNPTHANLGTNAALFPPATPAGEGLTFQIQGFAIGGIGVGGIATVHVMSVHRFSSCHAQAQAVISN
jgi:hypothetical protein